MSDPVTRQDLQAAPGLWTSTEVRDGRAGYEVRTGNRVYQQRLEHMGYMRTGAASFIRVFTGTDDVLRIHENFAADLEEMLSPKRPTESSELGTSPYRGTLPWTFSSP